MNYKGYECTAVKAYYPNKNTGIQLYETLTGELVATVTVNLGEELQAEDLAYIKDYSENEGMLDFLQEEGIVKEVVGMEITGYVAVPLCILDLTKVKDEIPKPVVSPATLLQMFVNYMGDSEVTWDNVDEFYSYLGYEYEWSAELIDMGIEGTSDLEQVLLDEQKKTKGGALK